MTGVLLGRFLIFGIIAWVAAIVLGVGSHFGLFRWRDRWPLAGMLAGLGTFSLYVNAYSMTVSLMGWAAGLFIGCGIATTYGTLFLRTTVLRPVLEPGGAEELLWLRDAVDRLSPQRLDWLLTAAFFTPGLGLIRLGFTGLFSMAPVVIGAVSLLGPLYAGWGLALRARQAARLQLEVDERERVAFLAPASACRPSPPSSSPPLPTRTG